MVEGGTFLKSEDWITWKIKDLIKDTDREKLRSTWNCLEIRLEIWWARSRAVM